jgi:hypothetical protein
MTIEIKTLGSGNRWSSVAAELLVDMSILEYMNSNPVPTVAAIIEGGNTVFYVANQQKYVDLMLAKGPAVLSDNLTQLLGTHAVPSLLVETFPNSKLMHIKQIQGELPS